MSKHAQRQQRRARYREMLRAELADEVAFQKRVTRTLNHDGLDFAPDGKRIKADFFATIDQWKKTDRASSQACLNLVEKALRQIQVKPVLSR